jgi:hypothetical protein
MGLSIATPRAWGAESHLLQPADDAAGTVLRVDERAVQAVRGPGAGRFPLRRGESLGTVVETAHGWVAAGGRETESARRLLLLASDGGAIHRLPAPPEAAGELQLKPALLVGHGTLEGIAWLEGAAPQRLEVKAARFEQDRWGAVETVAGPAAGSQTGLVGAALADGSWLLVWAANDGQDDEIVWSLRSGEVWSAPRRLHAPNEVPDVAPAVLATGSGALAAWSRYDGEQYATVVAAFDGAGWSAPRPVSAGGAFFPTFHRDGRRTRLVLRTALPRGWSVLELDAGGVPLRRARFATAETERPAVLSDTGADLTLSWPAGERPATASWESVR